MAEQTKVKTLEKVVIRFSGDSGDGMQLTGTIFSNLSAVFGTRFLHSQTIRQKYVLHKGTLSGVSGSGCTWDRARSSHPVIRPTYWWP